MSEAQLVRRAQQGDGEAFRFLVEQHQQVLFGTAYSMTRDRRLAEDLVQEALVKAWRGIQSFRRDGSFRAWCVRILVNEAMSAHRRKRLREAPLEDGILLQEGASGPEDEVLLDEERERLRRGLEQLREEQRHVVVLRYYTELSTREIAKTLGWSEGTVKSRLHRALRQLGTVLGSDVSVPKVSEGA